MHSMKCCFRLPRFCTGLANVNKRCAATCADMKQIKQKSFFKVSISAQDRLSAMGGVMTDAAVPEGHAGLHGFLYGDGGAEAHDSAGYSFREVRDTRHDTDTVSESGCTLMRMRLSLTDVRLSVIVTDGTVKISADPLLVMALQLVSGGHVHHSWTHAATVTGHIREPMAGSRRSCASRSTMYRTRLSSMQGEDDGSAVLPVSEYLEARDGERPVGVFALLDRRRNTQYVGYSRNMVLAIKARLSVSALRAHRTDPTCRGVA